jgi:hypothetical protein
MAAAMTTARLDSVCAIVLARQDYAFWIPAAYQVHVGALHMPLHIARNLSAQFISDRPGAVAAILRGWCAVLDASRLAGGPGGGAAPLRWIFLLIVGAFMFFAIMLERLLVPCGSSAEFHVHICLSILQTLLAVFGLPPAWRSTRISIRAALARR